MSTEHVKAYRDKDGRPRYTIAPGLRDAILRLTPGRPGVVETVGQVAAVLRQMVVSPFEPAKDRDRLRALRVQAESILAALDDDVSGIGIARGVAAHRGSVASLDDAARTLVDALRAAEDCVAESVRPGRAARSFPRQAVILLAATVDGIDGDADLLAALAAIALEAAGAGQHQGSADNLRREAVHALRRERALARRPAP